MGQKELERKSYLYPTLIRVEMSQHLSTETAMDPCLKRKGKETVDIRPNDASQDVARNVEVGWLGQAANVKAVSRAEAGQKWTTR